MDIQQHACPRYSAHRPRCTGGHPQSSLASTPVGTSVPRCAQHPDVPCCHGVPGARLGRDWLGGLDTRSCQGCCRGPVSRAHHSASSDIGAVSRGLTLHQSQNLWVGLTTPSGQEQFRNPVVVLPHPGMTMSAASWLNEVFGFSVGVAGVEIGQAVNGASRCQHQTSCIAATSAGMEVAGGESCSPAGILERASALLVWPGLYQTVKSNCPSWAAHCCFNAPRFEVLKCANGLLSVSTSNWEPSR